MATTLCAILLSYLIETRYNPAENHLFNKSYKWFSYSAAVFAFSDYLTRQCRVECTSVGRSHEIFTVLLMQGQIVPAQAVPGGPGAGFFQRNVYQEIKVELLCLHQ